MVSQESPPQRQEHRAETETNATRGKLQMPLTREKHPAEACGRDNNGPRDEQLDDEEKLGQHFVAVGEVLSNIEFVPRPS